MRSSTATRAAGLLALLLVVAGCANTTARVGRQFGPGPIAADADRPIYVGKDSAGHIPMAVPLLVRDVAGGSVSRCTVRGRWVSPEQRDSIVAAPDSLVVERFGSFSQEDSIEVRSPLDIPPSRSERGRVVSGSAGLITPLPVRDTPIDPDSLRNPLGDVEWSILLETRVGPEPGADGRCDLDAGSAATYLLVDFDTTRPIGGGLIGTGTLVLALVALTSLIAVGAGGP